MRVSFLAPLLLAAALSGCALQPARPAAAVPWHDEAFVYQPSLVAVSRDELFRLDPELAALLARADIAHLPVPRRVDAMMKLIYGEGGRRFGYVAGQSTPAAETWRRRSGDCLSLTVLAFAAGRALGLQPQMQEVRAPAIFDRRAGFDHVNRHVNVMFPLPGFSARDEMLQPRFVVIDFEPEYASRHRGQPLTEEAVLARFYNNLGVEALARGEAAGAYAHFKAAIAAEAGYAAPYANLAVLYRQRLLAADAERLLRRAIALSAQPDVPLATLHELLVEQGRTAEARAVAAQLREWQAADPYHWLALAIRHLEDGAPRDAIAALEHAQALTHGFAEVHRYMALAYWRLGERERAGEHLALLAQGDPASPALGKLKRKFKGQDGVSRP